MNNNNNGQAAVHDFTSEEPELFPDETIEIANTFHVTQKIGIIRRLESDIQFHQRQLDESILFYKEKMERLELRIGQVKLAIQGWLNFSNLQNIKTPVGTAYQKQISFKHWPSDDELLAWVLINTPNAIRLKREPDKKLISEHIKSTGEAPDGYTESSETRLYIK